MQTAPTGITTLYGMEQTKCPKCNNLFFIYRQRYDTIGRARIMFTPEMAKKYTGLLSSENNKLSYAEKMKDGTWDTHIAPLVIGSDGVMHMGYTRMAAQASAGVNIEYDVEIIQEVEHFYKENQLNLIHHGFILSEEQVRKIVG